MGWPFKAFKGAVTLGLVTINLMTLRLVVYTVDNDSQHITRFSKALRGKMTLSIIPLSTMIHSIMTFSIMAFSMINYYTQYNDTVYFTQYNDT